jgi:hypothetical protein
MRERTDTGQTASPTSPPLKKEVTTATVFVVIVCFWALGLFEYLGGLANSDMMILMNTYVFPLLALLTGSYLILLIVRVRNLRRLDASGMNVPLISAVMMVVLLALALLARFALIGPGARPFTLGFGHRMRLKADIREIRSWLDKQRPAEPGKSRELGSSDWPQCIRELHPDVVALRESAADLIWAGGFGRRGMVVGPPEMQVPPSATEATNRFTLAVAKGVFVWSEKE